MKNKLIASSCLLSLAVAAPLAFAKLPPPSPEAKAKLAETAARTAWSGKVESFKLCQSQDVVAGKYRASAAAAGKPVPAAIATPPCAEPGPFASVAPTEIQPPIEASGAHSPARTAVAPPSTNQTSAEQNPAPKK